MSMQILDVIRYVLDQQFKGMLGQPGGLATLNANGEVPVSSIPSLDHWYPRLVVSRTFTNSSIFDLTDVAMEASVYHLHINTTGATASGNILLLPNGAAYSNAFSHSTLFWTQSNRNNPSFQRTEQTSAFVIGTTSTAHILVLLSTYSGNKRIITLSAADENQSFNLISSWNSAVAQWTTLGSIIFPGTASGVVSLRKA